MSASQSDVLGQTEGEEAVETVVKRLRQSSKDWYDSYDLELKEGRLLVTHVRPAIARRRLSPLNGPNPVAIIYAHILLLEADARLVQIYYLFKVQARGLIEQFENFHKISTQHCPLPVDEYTEIAKSLVAIQARLAGFRGCVRDIVVLTIRRGSTVTLNESRGEADECLAKISSLKRAAEELKRRSGETEGVVTKRRRVE